MVDFYCPEIKLAIEVDGESHETREAREHDALRQGKIEKEGVNFVRFTDDEILGNADKVVQQIEQEVMCLGKSEDLLPPPHTLYLPLFSRGE